MFLEAYGHKLAPMKTVLPETNQQTSPENTNILRYAVRSYKESGFVFMLNFQDHLNYSDINNNSIAVMTAKSEVRFPSSGTFDMKKATCAIFPFNLTLGSTQIKSATVQPLTILKGDNENHYVFYSIEGIEPELVIQGDSKIGDLKEAKKSTSNGLTVIKGSSGKVFSFQSGKDQFLIIPYEMALQSNKIGEKLIFSDGDITSESELLNLVTRDTSLDLHVYPANGSTPKVTNANVKKSKSVFPGIDSYNLSFEVPGPIIEIEQATDRKYSVKVKGGLGRLNDVFLQVDYVGDRGMAFIDGLLTTDHFYHEKKWEIGMKLFIPKLTDKEMVLIFHPLYKDQECLIFFHNIPSFENGKYLNIKGIKTINEYKAIIDF